MKHPTLPQDPQNTQFFAFVGVGFAIFITICPIAPLPEDRRNVTRWMGGVRIHKNVDTSAISLKPYTQNTVVARLMMFDEKGWRC
jgi:hypothetical protein